MLTQNFEHYLSKCKS